MKNTLLQTAMILMTILLMVSCSAIDCRLKSKEEPQNLIERGKAEDMQNEYIVLNQERYQGITENILKDMRANNNFQFQNDRSSIDNTDIVFTLDNLLDYFCYIEREFTKLQKGLIQPMQEVIDYKEYNINDVGVRIYYGAKIDENNRDQSSELTTTVFLVPVVKLNPNRHDIKGILEARHLNITLEDMENRNIANPDPFPIYIDIIELKPLNFGHARRPPTLYSGYIRVKNQFNNY